MHSLAASQGQASALMFSPHNIARNTELSPKAVVPTLDLLKRVQKGKTAWFCKKCGVVTNDFNIHIEHLRGYHAVGLVYFAKKPFICSLHACLYCHAYVDLHDYAQILKHRKCFEYGSEMCGIEASLVSPRVLPEEDVNRCDERATPDSAFCEETCVCPVCNQRCSEQEIKKHFEICLAILFKDFE